MKDLVQFIKENKKFEEAYELIGDLAKKSKKEPDIWDDRGSWEARDAFEYWESAFGERDDTLDFIDEYASNKCVIGWSTEESFEATEKIVPKKITDIMKAEKPENPYKRRNNKFEVWETTLDGYETRIMRFMNYANRSGEDYVEYWVLVAVEE